MTSQQKHEMIRKINDAYNADYITLAEYSARLKAIHKAYFDATYDELDLSDIPV